MSEKAVQMKGGLFGALDALKVTKTTVEVSDLLRDTRCSSRNAEQQFATFGWHLTHHQGVVRELVAILKTPTKTGIRSMRLSYRTGEIRTSDKVDKDTSFELDTSEANGLRGVTQVNEQGHALSRRDGPRLVAMKSKPILLFSEAPEDVEMAMLSLLGFNVVIDETATELLREGETQWEQFSKENLMAASTEGVFDTVRGLLVADKKKFLENRAKARQVPTEPQTAEAYMAAAATGAPRRRGFRAR